MREAPPVSTTMPSASRPGATASAGNRQMNHRNPTASMTPAAAQIATVNQPMRRNSRPGAGAGGAAAMSRAPSSAFDPTTGIDVHLSRQIITQNSTGRGRLRHQGQAGFGGWTYRWSARVPEAPGWRPEIRLVRSRDVGLFVAFRYVRLVLKGNH